MSTDYVGRRDARAPYGPSAHFVRFGIVRVISDHIIAMEGHYCGFMKVFHG